MKKKRQRVSEQACLRVLKAIACERQDSRYISDAAIGRRALYSASYTRAVVRELYRRGWIAVGQGHPPTGREIQLTAQGRSQLTSRRS